MDAPTNTDVKTNFAIWNDVCIDMLTPAGKERFGHYWVFRRILESAVDGVPVEDCSSIKAFCSSDSNAGYKARLTCPVTCGCTQPGGVQILWASDSGCPPTCIS